jgi:hypothetical protein
VPSGGVRMVDLNWPRRGLTLEREVAPRLSAVRDVVRKFVMLRPSLR